MKKLISGIFMLIILTTSADAQGPMRGEAMEKVKAFRVEYFTRNLELTAQEAQAFWPIYDDFQAKKEAIKKQDNGRRKVELMDDAEVEQYLLNHLDNEQKLLDLKKDFFRKAKAVLPIRKVAMIPRVERQFRKKIVEEMQRRRQGARGNRQRGG